MPASNTSLSPVPVLVAALPDDCVARIRSGDIDAFEAVYRAMHAPLVAFGARYTGDTARAEELVQDLFFEIWSRRATWEVRGSVRAYLYAALRNRALNLRRRDGVEQDWAEAAPHEPLHELHAPASGISDDIDAEAQLAELRQALVRLPERCQLIMQMRWMGGLSYAEIASALDITVKGVEIQLSRGLKALRRALIVD
jgi:RNA polymerase sigma-70 factor, ECF subfamily